MDSSVLYPETVQTPFRVTDLKQWVYCSRILYYLMCLPDVRPTTFKMEAGIEAGNEEALRETRRSLRAYGLPNGRKEYELELASSRLGLRGKVDLVIWIEKPSGYEAIPVDYKLSDNRGEHFKLQLAAYAILLEDVTGCKVQKGFLYYIPARRTEEVRIDHCLRNALLSAVDAMHRMLWGEVIPAPTRKRGKCLACEFRRFCNDVI